MVQTRSSRRALAAEEAEPRTRSPVSQRRTRSSRLEANAISPTESQRRDKEGDKEKHLVQAESQPSIVQPATPPLKCSENIVIQLSQAEPEKKNLTELETYTICIENDEKQIVQTESQPSPVQSEVLGDQLELADSKCSDVENNADIEKEKLTEAQKANNHDNKGGDLESKTQSGTPAVIDLLLSSDEDKDTLSDGSSDVVLVESSENVIPGASTTPPVTTASPAANDTNMFVIDTQPGLDQDRKFYLDSSEESGAESGDGDEKSDKEEEDDFIDEDENENDEDDILKTKSKLINSSSSIDTGLNLKELGGLYITFDADKQGANSKAVQTIKDQKKEDELLRNSILTPEFEKRYCVPTINVSERQMKKKRKIERAKTAGDSWYNMKAPDLTDELKNDLRVLKMRGAMDPKRFYKKNDRDGFPKYFQVGEIVENPADFYQSRVPKKQRKQTMVEELLADAEFRRYNKRKYQQIMIEKATLSAGKKNRKKKKFKK
ncbi:deoxynucleotidyltransferase terminal-interacting protein 2 [Amblyraja radiata]|uniref:deoxynucleotidyltransferase terminal-interacting protein 2 n=1 Tax=Amblyraja radiata TaxID=386614 RepID=UPI0014034248|nr:deoxynucleotidyltransferase terminal-interacting protein 2 [Amblyraja radiata]XP_032884813.1 deoxynucleotidyltransferase terminal-interacting protein 2 [Amblyraja radiata]